MDIQGKTVVLLGGSGLVGLAVARRILPYGPKRLVVSALTREEAEGGIVALRDVAGADMELVPEWGDLFLPASLRERRRVDVLTDPIARAALLDDLYGELTQQVVARSTLGTLMARHTPEIVIDCVNTATAFAYQNIFESANHLRAQAAAGRVEGEGVERHLGTLYLPQLIRHVQIALESLRAAGTLLYLKIGTAGTGGMGLNIPFTHSEERPSRMLLAKSSLAGAHTLLLYLMARTPGAPAVKEIKPTAAISWKRIAYGEITCARRPLVRFDATSPIAVDDAFGGDAAGAWAPAGGALDGVFLDAGENGLFSLPEFEVLTSLGLMEYITPEEIADNVLREVRGHPTGRDVVAALDAATAGPTYRAGVLRQVAIERMEALEAQTGVRAVAYEMLGPPRLSKLLFESAILVALFEDLAAAAALDPDETARRAGELVQADADLRSRIVSIGLAILLPDGERVLRGPVVKVGPENGQSPRDPRLVENGWVDLRPAAWARWKGRLGRILHDLESLPGPELGSQADTEPGIRGAQLRPGRLAAWVFRNEDAGERVKR
ncbi:MAG: short-chain dehydrogenase [Longimicrobiales bacterium]